MSTARFQMRVVDSDDMAAARRRELDIDRSSASRLGEEAALFIDQGWYPTAGGGSVDWSEQVGQSRRSRLSIPPEASLPSASAAAFPVTQVEITNETTLAAAHRLVHSGKRPLVLNMANGLHPGGGFLSGSRAQEESLCRSSALYATLVGDPMYAAHGMRKTSDSTDWAILSPDVPIFRDEDGRPLDETWLASFITCAAPFAPRVGQPAAGDLLDVRIGRLLDVARAYGYTSLVLGAWGCGAYRNDPTRTARDFRRHLERHAGAFDQVVFAITDWSAERKFLGPFTEAFA